MNHAADERKLRRGRAVVIGLLTAALALILALAPLTAWSDSRIGGQETAAAQEDGTAAGADADDAPEAAADSLVEVTGEVAPLEDTVQEVAAPAGSGLEPDALSDYNAGDVAVIDAIIANNGLNWTPGDPDSWPNSDAGNGCVRWGGSAGNYWIDELYLNGLGLTGALDVSGCTGLRFFNALTTS